MRIVVYACEAGAANYLSANLRAKYPHVDLQIFADRAAGPTFASNGYKFRPTSAKTISEIRKMEPDLLLVGACVGATFEKRLYRLAKEAHIRIEAFVDHYLNLWQRFADPKTGRPWRYLPHKIYVVDSFVRSHLRRLGCQTAIAVSPNPSFSKTLLAKAKAKKLLAKDFGISPQQKVALFVSENLFRQSKRWKWDQATESEIRNFARQLFDKTKNNNKWHLIIKKHPAENRDWYQILGKGSYSVVGSYDRGTLLNAADAVFGFNSIMLIEALANKRPVFTLKGTEGAGVLRKVYPKIREYRDSVL